MNSSQLENRPRGRKSHGQTSKLYSVRIPMELAKKVDCIAKANQCNASAVLIWLLESHRALK